MFGPEASRLLPPYNSDFSQVNYSVPVTDTYGTKTGIYEVLASDSEKRWGIAALERFINEGPMRQKVTKTGKQFPRSCLPHPRDGPGRPTSTQPVAKYYCW